MAVWDIKERYNIVRSNNIDVVNRGTRGFWAGGSSGGATTTIDTIKFSSLGNSTDYGDLIVAGTQLGGGQAGSTTRSFVRMGGEVSGDAYDEPCEYINPTSTGNAMNFGNLTVGASNKGCVSNDIRACMAGGQTATNSGDPQNVIDYFTIASTGNAADFGDLTVTRGATRGISSPTRGVFAGGTFTPSIVNTIDYVTIASTGNATDFGDLAAVRAFGGTGQSSVRGVYCGGTAPGNQSDMYHITIASTGNAPDFGDLTAALSGVAGCSNTISALITQTAGIDHVSITSLGNAFDFGDLTAARTSSPFGSSNGHGGIPEEVLTQTRPSVTYMPGSGRGFTNAGTNSGGSGGSINRIQMTHIPTLGNAIDFGDCVSRQLVAGVSSITRSVIIGGESPSAVIDTMDSFEHASLGNAADFGNLSGVRRNMNGGGGNSTRGICAGGNTPSLVDIIEYITFTTAGNATDFGNLGAAAEGVGTCSGGTRTVHGGGNSGSEQNVIEYITTASTGNAADFGDLTDARRTTPASSLLRAVFMGGYSPGRINIIDYVTIASTGDAADFGDLTVARAAGSGLSNSTRAIHSGGEISGGDTVNQDYITIASTGNAADFGDLVEASQYHSGTSDSHGGLQS
tara:strand:- start:45 stop:1925 length:1881 start_codon:yes stop_codon:yes gene_type:complete